MVWALCTGVWPAEEIDHVNRVCSDDRLTNLRPATRQQNASNRKVHRNNRLGIMGVYYFRRTRKFRAMIRLGGRSVHLGYFPTAHEAAEAYARAARAGRGEFAAGCNDRYDDLELAEVNARLRELGIIVRPAIAPLENS